MGLDLSSLEGFTQELLEELARKHGIRGPEFRPRGELIRLLLRHHYGTHVQAGRESIVRGAALAAIGRTALGELLGLAVGPFLPKGLARIMGENAPSASEPSVGTNAASHAHHKSEGATVPAAPPPEPQTRTFIETPPRTRTMARMLAAEGHRARAIEIYRELLTHSEGEAPTLRAELEAIERDQPLGSRLNAAALLHSCEAFECEDRLAWKATASRALRIEWRVTDSGLRRARAVLGEPGEIAIRVVCIERDPTRVVHSVVLEHGPLLAQGEWMTPELHGAERTVLALGVRADDRFVAITHITPSHQSAPIANPPSIEPAIES